MNRVVVENTNDATNSMSCYRYLMDNGDVRIGSAVWQNINTYFSRPKGLTTPEHLQVLEVSAYLYQFLAYPNSTDEKIKTQRVDELDATMCADKLSFAQRHAVFQLIYSWYYPTDILTPL